MPIRHIFEEHESGKARHGKIELAYQIKRMKKIPQARDDGSRKAGRSTIITK